MAKETDYMTMAFDEIDNLDSALKKFAKEKGFDASFEYDDDATYLSFYPTDKSAQIEQYTLPQEAVVMMGTIAKTSKSDLVIQEGEKGGYEMWFYKSPRCVNSEESYTSICNYCDYIKSLLK